MAAGGMAVLAGWRLGLARPQLGLARGLGLAGRLVGWGPGWGWGAGWVWIPGWGWVWRSE